MYVKWGVVARFAPASQISSTAARCSRAYFAFKPSHPNPALQTVTSTNSARRLNRNQRRRFEFVFMPAIVPLARSKIGAKTTGVVDCKRGRRANESTWMYSSQPCGFETTCRSIVL